MIDIHSHLIPDVDDGTKTPEESEAIIRGLKDLGFNTLIITPHFVSETAYTSPRQTNRLKLAKLQDRLKNTKIDLFLGNEIYIDREIEKYLKTYQISPLADTKYLLIELPMSGEFEDYESILTSLLLKGYRVILAHPERYHSFQKNYNRVRYLYENGVLFQSNFGSLVGQYGKKPEKLVKKMIKDDLIYTFSTDIHHKSSLSHIEKSLKKLKKYYSSAELDQILDKNPRQILDSVIK